MTPHPDFETLEFPTSFPLGAFQMDILTVDDLDEDFREVTRSADVLRGLFGPTWPDGLTRSYNATDLHWHHREFTAKRSFAWVIRDAETTYLGCAYFSPDMGKRGSGLATYWIVDRPDRRALLAEFGPLYTGWLTRKLPSDYKLRVQSNASL